MKKAVFCLAKSTEHADRIVARLQENGFRNEDISVLYANRNGDMKKETGSSESWRDKRGTLGTEKHTKAPEGAATGATTGGIIGGSLGLLAGIGALAIPGFGPFIAAGPIMGALSGSAVGGAVGLVIGSLVGLGLPEYEAKKYENAIGKGQILICAHTANSEQIEKANDLLKKEGAHDISTTTEATGAKL